MGAGDGPWDSEKEEAGERSISVKYHKTLSQEPPNRLYNYQPRTITVRFHNIKLNSTDL